MVEKRDITKKSLEGIVRTNEIINIIEEVLGTDIELKNMGSGVIIAAYKNNNQLLSVVPVLNEFTLYNPNFEQEAEKIAENYEKLFGEKTYLFFDYSGFHKE